MNLTRGRREPQPTDPMEAVRAVAEQALTALPQPLPDPADEHERAEALRAEAGELRAAVARDRGEAEARLSTARSEAARLVGEAERQAREVATETNLSASRAAGLEEEAGFWAHAGMLRDQAEQTDDEAARLAAQRDEQQATADALDRRLAELAEQRQRAEADLATARRETDVDGAAEARSRLDGLGEVVPVLQAQRDQARAAARAIGGETDGAQLTQTLAKARALRAERERVLDRADPSRVELRRQQDPLGAFAILAAEHPDVVAKVIGERAEKPVNRHGVDQHGRLIQAIVRN